MFRFLIIVLALANINGDKTIFLRVPSHKTNISFIDEKKDISERCCSICVAEKSMYYSIDTTTDMCGQTCIYDNMYYLYKLFEPGLKKANQNLICPIKGYSKYVSTVTHGFLFVKDTLDLYEPFDYLKSISDDKKNKKIKIS